MSINEEEGILRVELLGEMRDCGIQSLERQGGNVITNQGTKCKMQVHNQGRILGVVNAYCDLRCGGLKFSNTCHLGY